MTTYGIDGMTCGGCVSSLTKAFANQMPNAKVTVSLDEGGKLEIDGTFEKEAIKGIVEDAGFEVRE